MWQNIVEVFETEDYVVIHYLEKVGFYYLSVKM